MRLAVTGGISGIGKATVMHLLAQGHEVTVFDIKEPDYDVDYIPLNLMDEGSIFAALEQATGIYDGLCHIAGVPPRDDNTFMCLNINAIAAFSFIEGFLPKLKKGAAVVSVASKAGAGWEMNTAQLDSLIDCAKDELESWAQTHEVGATLAYKLSKQAMIYWSVKQVSQYIGQTRFVTVSPAAVDTGILTDFKNAFGPQVEVNLARVGRPGKAEEVASTMAFLISEDASWLNGIDIVIDGGMGALNFNQ